MKNKRCSILTALIAVVLLWSGCGSNPEITQFKNDLDAFCDKIAQLDADINEIDAQADNAIALAMGYLDKLDAEFSNFAAMDFPEEYDYLEKLADEAGTYMKESVASYHLLYEGDDFDQDTADYARENSARAFKRVQVIIDVLQGEYEEENTVSGS